MKKIIRKILSHFCLNQNNNEDVDKIFLENDKKKILRTKPIKQIPEKKYRIGGKNSYAEWAYVIGVFQTLIYFELKHKEGNKILDIGCGTGLMSMACEPFIEEGGKYIGVDVIKEHIDFDNNNYTNPLVTFKHFNVNNPSYASNQSKQKLKWDFNDNTFDMITALSVWTHLSEDHAIFYLREVNRVLKKGGKAIITFFYLDKHYYESLARRKDEEGKFHSTNQTKWVFNNNAYDSKNWFCPTWVKVPEDAIGVNKEGMKKMLKESKLKLANYYSGNWKERQGVYFQDILVFEKA